RFLVALLWGDYMSEKICIVIIGLGHKTDYRRNIEIKMDDVYRDLILPLMNQNFPQYKVLRADDLLNPGVIDFDMYRLLFQADLVIADITTLNANAIYELGIRHAIKPSTTMILACEKEERPFDLNHIRILS